MTIFDKIRPHSCFGQSDAKRGTQIKNASNGGYILVYVMVVVLTLCILAASICTSAVRNLKVQQNSIEHMKFVYKAEGIGERFVAELQRAMTDEENVLLVPVNYENATAQHKNALVEILRKATNTALANALPNPANETIALVDSQGNKLSVEDLDDLDNDEFQTLIELKFEDSVGALTMQLCIMAGDSELDTEIQWVASVAMRDVKDEATNSLLISYCYYIDDIDSPIYNSYEIKAADTTH